MDQIAENIPISEARANITDVIASVRLLRRCVFLARRGKPQAAVVPVELGELIWAVGGVDAATAILAGHVPKPDAPPRDHPTPPTPGTCSLACIETHMYEGACVVSPMIIGTISPRVENGITGYAWLCDWDQECGVLRHLGYPSAAAARRAYDRHFRTEHGDLSPRAE